jgi:two-component system, NarL family, nitrate/nitrite response regulator NarL
MPRLMRSSILIVDDHVAARTAIRYLLNQHDMQVCGEAENGKEAIEKVTELRPDLVVLDINMPVMDGIEAAYQIRRIAPSTKILFFTIHDSAQSRAATRMLSDGFISKSTSATELIPTVKRVLGAET